MISDVPRGYRLRYTLTLLSQLLGYAAAAGVAIAGFLTLVIMLLLASAGCSKPPNAGVVLNKDYSAPYSWVSFICAGYDSRGMCTVHVPLTITEPAHYRLCLIDDADPTAIKAGTCRLREVDPGTFRDYREGDHYPRTDPR
jgi:hypothetical protein